MEALAVDRAVLQFFSDNNLYNVEIPAQRVLRSLRPPVSYTHLRAHET